MTKHKFLLYIISLSLILNCDRQIANLTGKCDNEKKKSNKCLLATTLACENSSDAARYKKQGIGICTNSDGYLFMITAFCDTPVECKPTPKSNNSKRK